MTKSGGQGPAGESIYGEGLGKSLVNGTSGMLKDIRRHWFVAGTAVLLLWVGLPWLAPALMKIGWQGPAKGIYFLYSFQCHQLPQRSFFLFGQRAMYSLADIHTVWSAGNDPMALRQFVGTADLGYKVAWSDRMVSAYGSIPLAALLWWPLRRKIKPLSFLGLILFMLPMAVDGSTHLLSDFAGIGRGFRYTNEWLAGLTGHQLPASFYLGNALGSFNSWMRLVTGALFGVGLVWFSFPHLERALAGQAKGAGASMGENGSQHE